ncbi:agl cluster protein AglQ [Halobacteria archaeon AArc-curdl1]|uniref:Agl cluster protein AglQ n=1 Tax=Natronosalvus hydrolyticus TaxID=2979988 RepID=A0AAP2ZBD3_9EURY|nr:agl cluster protein AglQ [Halobacteria archaeon AArc-curdl1]
MVKLNEILLQVVEYGLERQKENGSMPAGHNGPYSDPETPVRNTSHWLIIFLNAYEQNGDVRFRNAAERAIEYLQSEEARPNCATFYHRNSCGKDRCNGVVGQAWTIEALTVAGQLLNQQKLISIAKDVFLLHPFNESVGYWKKVDIDGDILGIDLTFNHQLWFAAAGGLLVRHGTTSEEIEKQVLTFLDHLERNISIRSSGLIYHRSVPNFGFETVATLARDDLKLFILSTLEWTNLTESRVLSAFLNSRFAPVRRAPLSGEEHINKSIGYHSFNLYALALLYQSFPDHKFWSTNTFEAILSYADSQMYIVGLHDNKFGYAYNPPGFEIPFALQTFRGNETHNQQKDWLTRQLELTYNPETKRLDRNNIDPETLTARLYEATRLQNLEFPLEVTEPSPESSS